MDSTRDQERSFHWPENRRAAISLTFDDARQSQLDRGIPILDRYGVRATFYVSFKNLDARLEDWQSVAENGHEIGNHSVSHPCSGNFTFARGDPLEDYDLERMERDILQANDEIERRLGVRPRTFAYPCGQKFVGRGEGVRSYVPVVAKHFLAGRGFCDETHNNPVVGDPAQAMGVDFDRATFERVQSQIAGTVRDGGWLVLAGHDVGDGGGQTVQADTLDALCRHAIDPANGLWIDTVAAVAGYIQSGIGIGGQRD